MQVIGNNDKVVMAAQYVNLIFVSQKCREFLISLKNNPV